MAGLSPTFSHPVQTRVRCSEGRARYLASPFTVAGRPRRVQQQHCPALASSAALPVVERLHVLEGQNSIVPAPTLGSARRIEEVGTCCAIMQSTPHGVLQVATLAGRSGAHCASFSVFVRRDSGSMSSEARGEHESAAAPTPAGCNRKLMHYPPRLFPLLFITSKLLSFCLLTDHTGWAEGAAGAGCLGCGGQRLVEPSGALAAAI